MIGDPVIEVDDAHGIGCSIVNIYDDSVWVCGGVCGYAFDEGVEFNSGVS